ncbi:hypothetical protein OS493_002860 [Desmophyllum pertusum]|uniref:Uncharacterized protein n=1 Tax=Desmophyllum pertusum TaxID=174260 RepID=A0A9X0CGV9_9CNID|nr:hypothetical protein OS493_002860 [Desmophyllum pertusum]
MLGTLQGAPPNNGQFVIPLAQQKAGHLVALVVSPPQFGLGFPATAGTVQTPTECGLTKPGQTTVATVAASNHDQFS